MKSTLTDHRMGNKMTFKDQNIVYSGSIFDIGLSPRELTLMVELLKLEGIFDQDFYLERYPDVRLSGLDPAWHYMAYGYRENRQPSAVIEPPAYDPDCNSLKQLLNKYSLLWDARDICVIEDTYTLKSRNKYPNRTTPFHADAAIDLVDACNLACRTCPRGVRLMPNRRHQMPIKIFEKIIGKLINVGACYIELYNWCEPFLCSNLLEYVMLCKAHGLHVGLSSNLSLKNIPDLINVLKFTDYLLVSVSGFNQETYKKNHLGGNVETVKKNLALIGIAKRMGMIDAYIRIRYFNFKYALPEFQLFKDFAQKWGLEIELLVASGNPLTSKEQLKNQFNLVAPCEPNFGLCALASRPMPISSNGDVYLCCARLNTEKTKVGNILKDDYDTLQYRRAAHPLCSICSSKIPMTAPREIADEIGRGARKLFELL